MINKSEHTFLKKKLPLYIKMASSVSLAGVMGVVGHAYAADQKAADATEEIVVTGQRASIESAQDIKKKSNVIVDSIVAEDIGKLPDRSVTDALQRVPGIAVNRYDQMSDPEHYSGEGSGVSIRGLTQVRSELNGRDIFSAANGRSLSFEDVPAELMSGVDVYKSPSADMIEGGLGGTVNLRTRMPFDSAGQVASITVKSNYGDQIKQYNGEYSGLYSNRWTTDAGEFGVLVDLSTSDLSSRADNVYTRAFIPRTDVVAGETVYVPKGADWRRNDYKRTRDGDYVALQWAPNDKVEVYLTGFTSKYDSQWNESAFFIDQYAGIWAPVQTSAADWKFDSNNALVSGTTTAADSHNGISFGTSTRLAHRINQTTDISTGIKWSPDDNWKFNADLQHVDSKATTEDYTLGLVVFPKTVAYNNLNSEPNIAVDSSYLANPSNYSLGQMMSMPSVNNAGGDTFKFDAEYSFSDSIIKSIKAGARFTNKNAVERAGNQWVANYQPWQVASWSPFNSAEALPKVSSDNASKLLTLTSYDNFQRGKANVPVAGMMFKWNAIQDFKTTADYMTSQSPGGCCSFNWAQIDPYNPANVNSQTEKTSAIYAVTNFAFEDLAMPIDGNVGVRLVKTDNTAHGNLTYPTFSLTDNTGSSYQPYYQASSAFNAKNTYTNVLPSLNLRLKATDELYFRVAASEAIWAPDFSQLAAKIPLSIGLAPGVSIDPSTITPGMTLPEGDILRSIDMSSNPYLKPMRAKQFDISAEWYFDEHGGMAHAAFFKKNISDFFRMSHGTTVINGETWQTNWLGNVGSADVNGFELGVSKFFDKLPAPFDGLGVEANYTHINSSTKVTDDAAPVDTDGSTYGKTPMEGLSKDAYNLVAMYEKDGVSARLAWNWRSKYLVAVGPNGWNGNDNGIAWRLPVYNDAYGQLDASVSYSFLENYTVTLEASNLTKENTKGIIDQTKAGDHTAYVYSQDVRYALSLRAKF